MVHLPTLLPLTLLLSNTEYTLTLLLHTTATLLSLSSLLTGPPPLYQQALHQILTDTFPTRATSHPHPHLSFLTTRHILTLGDTLGSLTSLHVLKIVYIFVFLLWNIFHEISPLIFESLRRARRGRPVMLVSLLSTAGFTTMLLRYRSTFFIALQVHRMFVALGFFLLAVGMLGLEFISDRIQLRESRRRLAKMKVQARGLVSEETRKRMRELESARTSDRGKAKLTTGRLKED